MSRRLLFAWAAAVALASPLTATAQVKPRIMIAFDTSGSMALDLIGTTPIPTFGDGVLTGCTAGGSGQLCGANCTAGIDTDCDGLANDSRMFVAKEAVRNMVLAFGDVDWGLARFSQNQGTNLSCLRVNNYECNTLGPFVTSYGNPQCNTGTAIPHAGCPFDWASLIPAACRPGSGGRPPLRSWSAAGGGSPNVCTNYAGTCTGGNVLVGFNGLGAFTTLDNGNALVKWVDAQESNYNSSTTVGNWCNHASTGNCELRPEGPTPLAGLLNASFSYVDPIRDVDPQAMCRPYSVILLTDGIESCEPSCFPPVLPENCVPPRTAAATLLANGILTYVVGLAVAGPSERLQLNRIATAGGTDAGAAGGDTAFFADDPATLSAGLADIVRRSLLVETCNGLNDDCDAFIDEGFPLYCNWNGIGMMPTPTLCTDPGETLCDNRDNNCDGMIDEGLRNACGTCGPTPTEICDGMDNDCDGVIDEGGVCGGCMPSGEICDGVDNDCDMNVDEGVTRPCGAMVGRCTVGTEICTAGVWGTCSGVGPIPETCNNVDDDCDGIVDGITRACGSGVGACQPGSQMCTAGAWGTCVGAIGPMTEVCDGSDNNCNGSTDEGNPGGGGACGSGVGSCAPGTLMCTGGMLMCSGGTGPVPETCNDDDDDCDGATDESVPTMGSCGTATGECSPGVLTCVSGTFTCVGGRGPVPEVCDGLDNNCNSSTDEGNPGGGVACGTSTGECAPGTSQCMGGMLRCIGGVSGVPELCNTRDDDCDGLSDEGNPGGGAPCGMSTVGDCEDGALACVAGSLTCVGGRGPVPERCDSRDNDCDGPVDEGNPEAGMICGATDEGECDLGLTECTGGMLVCDGEVGPVPEMCNALDDDCDSFVDDGLGLMGSCGSDVGECSPGVRECCSPATPGGCTPGTVVCTGEVGPRPEECNLLDDDCDTAVDELPLGAECGNMMGLCMIGNLQCIDGVEICVGGVTPVPEVCNCDDDDCDGPVDEGSLCPPGTACRDCSCADRCTMSEFGFTCPTGTTPQVEGADCWCVAPRCNDDTCAMETVEVDGETRCAPDSDVVSHCVCRNNACTHPCEGVVCMGGLVCDPRSPEGRCVEDNCRGLGCATGEVCNRVTGDCEVDPCAAVTCGSGEACRNGTCEPSCGTVTCGAGERCTGGVCVDDPCDGVSCGAGEICHPDTGECVDDLCGTVSCPIGTVCDPRTGECEEDPCARLHCPEGEICVDGECTIDVPVTPDGGTADAGVDGGTTPGDEHDRVLAGGGGGCVCSAPGSTSDAGSEGEGALAIVAGLVTFVAVRRRRRRRARFFRGHIARSSLAGIVAVLLALTGGCNVDPYCLDCVEPADGGPDGARSDGGPGMPDTGPIDAVVADASDAGPDACLPEVMELCNGIDDNCNGEIDEDINTDIDVNNCGGCGMRCAPANAFPVCTAGVCGLDRCRTGFYDLDGDLTNGCEYRCPRLTPDPDDTICNAADDDCDGNVDEDVDFDSDPDNCGGCGIDCRFAHAAGACTSATCALGTCDAGFYDIDGSATNGCEYSCTLSTPPTELCNGRDDDCDGTPDEGDPEGGGTCGSNVGACTAGTNRCTMGSIVCMGEVVPAIESCNGADDDCDGTSDEGNPGAGRDCGPSVGACVQGREQCVSGALACVGATGPVPESCNGLDDDCDGDIDESDPGGGGSCGPGTGSCMPGTNHCRGGVIVCEGAVGPVMETCDGADQDCDGMTDEGNPGGGAQCGTDTGECTPGTRQCMTGSLVCVGAIGPGTESCNSLDEDCDASIDEGNPGGGGSCGTGTGECTPGTLSCLGGVLQCSGGSGPMLETCNTRDDDCDGPVDEGFMLMTDVNNCGSCGNVCNLPFAIERCASGVCGILACETGHVNLDGVTANGCEYACSFAGAEVCNGRDDNCDGTADNGLTPPANFCNPNGVCAGTTAMCGGMAGWQCTYPPATYQPAETRCDNLDNDCDGLVDEPFPNKGTSCGNGVGECRVTGTFVCNMAGTATVCNAGSPGTPVTEACDNLDNDCDGVLDNGVGSPTGTAIATTRIPRASAAGFVRVMRYEASRPDATSSSAGGATQVACSTADRIPWTNVTWPEARDACCALNASGTCSGTVGWRLCDVVDWQSACQGPAGTCTWAYSSMCSTSQSLLCNGEEYDCSGTAGDQDCLLTTGSPTFPMCRQVWPAGSINDMSGNVKEWTLTVVPGVTPQAHYIRGGSYNNLEPGRTCAFDFTVGANNFSFPNTGFRCCYYE